MCQCCKENFNAFDKAPYLLKCGHFFCKFCLENNYTDEKGSVYCPEDGLIAKNIKELQILYNLIVENNKNNIEEENIHENNNNNFKYNQNISEEDSYIQENNQSQNKRSDRVKYLIKFIGFL